MRRLQTVINKLVIEGLCKETCFYFVSSGINKIHIVRPVRLSAVKMRTTFPQCEGQLLLSPFSNQRFRLYVKNQNNPTFYLQKLQSPWYVISRVHRNLLLKLKTSPPPPHIRLAAGLWPRPSWEPGQRKSRHDDQEDITTAMMRLTDPPAPVCPPSAHTGCQSSSSSVLQPFSRKPRRQRSRRLRWSEDHGDPRLYLLNKRTRSS